MISQLVWHLMKYMFVFKIWLYLALVSITLCMNVFFSLICHLLKEKVKNNNCLLRVNIGFVMYSILSLSILICKGKRLFSSFLYSLVVSLIILRKTIFFDEITVMGFWCCSTRVWVLLWNPTICFDMDWTQMTILHLEISIVLIYGLLDSFLYWKMGTISNPRACKQFTLSGFDIVPIFQ